MWVLIRRIEDEIEEFLWEWKLGFQIGGKEEEKSSFGFKIFKVT
jgi:hypothetical protein